MTFALKGRIPLLKNITYFVLLFQSYGRYTTYMQPYVFPQKKYTSTSYFFVSFCIIAECFNQLIHNLVKVHRKLCTYRHQHMLLGKPFSLRICTQRIPFWHCCPSSTTYLKELCTAVSEHDFAFMSNTCCTPLCKGTAQNDITSWKDLVLC